MSKRKPGRPPRAGKVARERIEIVSPPPNGRRGSERLAARH